MIKHGSTGKKNWYLVKGKKFFYEPASEKERTEALRKARLRDKERLIIIGH